MIDLMLFSIDLFVLVPDCHFFCVRQSTPLLLFSNIFTPLNEYFPADAGYDSDDREPLTVGQTQPVFGRVSHEFDDEAHRSVGDQEARVKEAAAVVRARLQEQQPGQDAEVADGFEQLGRPMEVAGAEGAYCPPAAAVEEAANADRAEHAEDVDRGIVQGVNAPHPER